jgi:Uncharacterised protein family (UPF0175)
MTGRWKSCERFTCSSRSITPRCLRWPGVLISGQQEGLPGLIVMQITVDIPDEFLSRIVPPGSDAARALLEESVAAAYRNHRLTMEQVRQVLDFGTRMEVDAFLQRHEIYDYTVDDLQKDMTTLGHRTKKKVG